MLHNEEYIWVEKYRPKTIKDTILPTQLKATLQQFVDKGDLPNFTFSGPPGCGKTTAARAILEELGCDYLIINGSLSGNIDTLRNDILQFASSMSLTGGRKYVILDEADHLTHNTQAALRNFMEEYSKNCGFILTCNFKNKIMPALHSRAPLIEFTIPKSEIPSIATQILKRVMMILDAEGIEYDKVVIGELIKKHFPDWRRVIGEVQRYSVGGKIDTGILANTSDASIKQLLMMIKDKDFTGCRKWIGENNDMETSALYRKIYDLAPKCVAKDSMPILVLLISKYQYQAGFCADHEINTMALFVEMMVELAFQ